MKKAILATIVFVLFALLLLLSAISSLTVFAVSQPTLRVDTVEGRPGDAVSVPVTIDNNPGIIALRIFVEYDAEKLQLTDVQDSNVFPAGRSTFNKSILANPLVGLLRFEPHQMGTQQAISFIR